MAAEISVNVNGLQLAGQYLAARQGEPVLALHGWLDNSASFAPLAASLAPAMGAINLVAWDAPGHGKSQHRPLGCAYHFADWVGDALEFADALAWDSFHLIGHSMGAGIASLVAAVAPERLRSLVLIEGLGPLSGEPTESTDRLRRAIDERKFFREQTLRVFASEEEMVQRLQRALPNLPVHGAEAIARRNIKKSGTGYGWSYDPRLQGTSPLRLSEDVVLAFLKRIVTPTLLIQAADGYSFDASVMAMRCAQVAPMQVARLAGGHHVHMQDADAVAAVVKRFWAALTTDE